jgi:ribonuclease HI
VKARVIVDGRGNAGPQGACAAVLIPYYGSRAQRAVLLGDVSNNEAEFKAVILGMDLAKELEIMDLTIWSDSKLVVNTIIGEWTLKKPHLLPLRSRVLQLGAYFENVFIEWVPRKITTGPDQLCRDICEDHFGQARRSPEIPSQ